MDLAAKLQIKPGQAVEALRAPESLAATLSGVELVTEGHPDAALLVFVANRSILEDQRTQIVEAPARDRLTWVSYPKGEQLGTDLNRDSLAASLREIGVRPVRQIAIDDVGRRCAFAQVDH